MTFESSHLTESLLRVFSILPLELKGTGPAGSFLYRF